jgi:hypothetical protein
MSHGKRWTTLATIVASGVGLAACGPAPQAHESEHPAEVVRIEGSDLSRVTLTARAIERIDLRTEEVREERVASSGSSRRIVPYSALIYDPQGVTWVYTSPEPGSFVRHKVEVDHIDGDTAILKDGPPAGTLVASVGVAELYGTEFGVGH